MKPIIINNCKRTYRIDAEKIFRKVIDRVPEKYLHGLGKVVLFESDNDKYNRMIYTINGGDGKAGLIKVNMAYEEYSRYPFFSIFALNMDFIFKLNEHVHKYIIPMSDDPEILKHPESRINYNWTYFGVWTPLVYLFNLLTQPFRKLPQFRNTVFRIARRIIEPSGDNQESDKNHTGGNSKL